MKELIQQERIEQRIFLVRGHKVMLDRDLAELYGVATKYLTRQVRRNIDRFPGDFMFILVREEYQKLLRCQFGSLEKGKYSKYLPYVFTEQGIAMLSGVLRSTRAVQVNIAIMRAFVRLRQLLVAHKELAERLAELERKVGTNSTKIRNIFKVIRQMMEPPPGPKLPKRRIVGFHP
ncbi:MAG: ORF6N domain-containing protein [Candidatus Omnitrophica bacterium]|nr:ORF6N domain-containing protein [Candidatus Omnitrophota bacterium]